MISRILLTFSIALFAASSFITQAVAQQRDHLTPQEVDLVKEAQMLDKRIDVFIKATERRIMVINGSGAAAEPLMTIMRRSAALMKTSMRLSRI